MSGEVSQTHKIVATAGVMLATLTYTLDATIANIALPHMQGSLSASGDQMVWVLTSFIVATAVMTPFSGWLSMRIGRKRLFLAATALFIVASMLCGMATSLPQIVAYRVIQGLAGASLIPQSQAIMLDMWPPSYMPRMMALWSGVVTAAPIIGPTLGGYLTDTLSWRWAFYINAPLDVLAIVMIVVALPMDEGGKQRPLDLLGFLGVAMFSVGTQLVMDRGELKDWFDSTEIWIEACMAGGGLYLFLVQMFTTEQPFFNRDLFSDLNFVSSLIYTTIIAMVMFASSALVPVLLQQLMHYSATQAGIVIMPRGFGSIIAFIIAPWLTGKIGPRPTMLFGLAVGSFSLWQMGHFELGMDAWPVEVSGFLQGAAMGFLFNPMTVLCYATLAPVHRTEASVLSNMARSIGGSIGIAIYATVQLRQSASARDHLTAHVSTGDAVLGWRLPDLLGDGGWSSGGSGLAALNAEVNRQAAMIGYNTAFGYMCLSGIALLPLLLLMRPAKGGKAPGMPMEPVAH